MVDFASAKEHKPWSEVQKRIGEAVWTEATTSHDLLFDEEATLDREPADVRSMRVGLGGMTLQSPPRVGPPPPEDPEPSVAENTSPAVQPPIEGAESLTFKPSEAKAPGLPFRRGGLVLGQSGTLASFGLRQAAPSTTATPFRPVGSSPPSGSSRIHVPTPRQAPPIATTIGQRVSDEESARVTHAPLVREKEEAKPDPLSIERYAAIKATVWSGGDLALTLARENLSLPGGTIDRSAGLGTRMPTGVRRADGIRTVQPRRQPCLLYTSDAADE